MPSYLVTGGAGFIGSHIATALTARGDRVRVLDNFESGRAENLAHLDVELIEGDIRSTSDCERAMENIDGVFHEAAQVSVPDSVERPHYSYEVNVTGTLNVLEAARAAGVKRAVFAASSAAYGDSEELPKVEDMPVAPCSPYASGKIAGEHLMRTWARCFGMQTVCLRYFNVFGPRQGDDSPYSGVIAKFARILLDGRRPTIFGDGGQTRDFVYVDNIVRANLLAMDQDVSEPGAVINIGAGESITLLELYRAMAAEVGIEGDPDFGPERTGDVRHSAANLDRSREILGYEPTVAWRDGLRTTLDWYRAETSAQGPV